MIIDDLIKTLSPILLEEVIRNIASYLVMNINKNDNRYQLLEAHYSHNIEHRVNGRFYTGNIFFYDITFSNPKYTLSIMRYYNDFIKYQFINTATNEIHSDRCWFTLRDMSWMNDSTNYWQQFFIDGWLPNPNTTIIV